MKPGYKLHRPLTALGRIQQLAGMLKSAAGDRNPNRAAQIASITDEIFNIALAAQSGGPLPEQRDHKNVC